MARIIWLASYPKSGNTWIRFIFANLIFGKVESSNVVHRLVPDLHVGLSWQHLKGDRRLMLKTHLKYFDKMPLREDAIGVVYILRNPLDVIVSALNYFEVVREPLSDERRQAFVAEFIEHGGLNEWKQLGFGAWDENVTSWHAKDMPLPRLTLRYEDLKANPADGAARLCRFLNLKRSEKEIDDAIAASSFDKVRAMEEEEVALGRPGLFALENRRNVSGKRFMNKGASDAYRETLTEDQISKLRERFGPVMSHFGYGV
jgi:hypothetical protein